MSRRHREPRHRRRTLGTVLALLSLPLLVALSEAVTFHLHNRNNGSIISSGEQREYLLHVPDTYDPRMPTPLVISLHGGAIWPALQRDLSGWNHIADRHGFLVAYPAGVRLDGAGPRGWRVTGQGPGIQKDVDYLVDLIDELGASYSVDRARIYVNGLSNGGGMAFALSCTLSDRIAAIGLVASAQMLPWSWCPDPRPVPMISFHGTADRFVPYDGGHSWVAPPSWSFPGTPEWTENWARRNRCAGVPIESEVAVDVSRQEYTGCADDASVVLFTVHGGGHTWPGGPPVAEWFLGPTSHGVDATREMWAFFAQHRLSSAGLPPP